MPAASDEVRTQLVLVARTPPAQPSGLTPLVVIPAPPPVVFSTPRSNAPIAGHTPAGLPAPGSSASERERETETDTDTDIDIDTNAAPFDWQQQARESADRQAPSEAPDFAADPLRSRRARLPGGTQAQKFRMREPVTPAKVAGLIGQLFGGPGDPCPRVRANISGLLTATSDHDRELLTEELRQFRDYCRP